MSKSISITCNKCKLKYLRSIYYKIEKQINLSVSSKPISNSMQASVHFTLNGALKGTRVAAAERCVLSSFVMVVDITVQMA